MVKRFTTEGHEYWEPPYSKEETAILEKSMYGGNIQTMARSHRWSDPAPEVQPASKQTAPRQGRKALRPS